MSVLEGFTPTEYLIGEVLAARYRLGEATWTFPTEVRKALRSLEARNLIGWKSGIVENTCLVWLTPAGRESSLSEDYTPPVFAQ